jgi:hypothetical protein
MEREKLSRVRIPPEDAAEAKHGRRYFVVREGNVYRLKTLPPRHRDGREVLEGSLGKCGGVYRVAVGAVKVRLESGAVDLLPLSRPEVEELAVESRCLP